MDASVAHGKPLETLREHRRSLGADASPAVRDELAVIEAALDRIAAGSYGLCVACGRAITPDRLAFLPATPHCLGCAAEVGHARGGRIPTVPAGEFRGEHLGILTDVELAHLLAHIVRHRPESSPRVR